MSWSIVQQFNDNTKIIVVILSHRCDIITFCHFEYVQETLYALFWTMKASQLTLFQTPGALQLAVRRRRLPERAGGGRGEAQDDLGGQLPQKEQSQARGRGWRRKRVCSDSHRKLNQITWFELNDHSRYGVDDEDEDEEADADTEDEEMESYLLDQYKIRAKLDVLKDDVQAVIPITKVFDMFEKVELLIPFLYQGAILKWRLHNFRDFGHPPPLVCTLARSIVLNPRNLRYYVCIWATPSALSV